MKFLVTRTSVYDEQPCEEAHACTYVQVDENMERIHVPESDWWYSAGTNHRVVDGRMFRDFQYTGWFVDLVSLDDLVSFVKKHGKCVIDINEFRGINKIEIYDGWTVVGSRTWERRSKRGS